MGMRTIVGCATANQKEQLIPQPRSSTITSVDTARIAELLAPFLTAALSDRQLADISTYIDLLLRWNARTNLTAIRDPESIVTRHFGESLFAAQTLFPAPAEACPGASGASPRPGGAPETPIDLLDIGSGPGFPGLPIKLWAPALRTTLLESQHKKVAFLREVIRALTLTDIDVYPGRAEHFSGQAQLVTLRAVERFDAILPIAASRLVSQGRLALLIGEGQVPAAHSLTSGLRWNSPIPIPAAKARILLMGSHGL
jgi:16S rRNA (guanine527-N7)-methyltransferase